MGWREEAIRTYCMRINPDEADRPSWKCQSQITFTLLVRMIKKLTLQHRFSEERNNTEYKYYVMDFTSLIRLLRKLPTFPH